MLPNPLAGAAVGSTIDRVSGVIHATVLPASSAVTVLVAGEYNNSQVMRGESTSVYTTHMNQGSVSMSGSYGITGIEKVTAAASAYWGASSATNSMNTTIVCEVLEVGSVETLSLDQIKPSLLLAALTPGAHDDAKTALQKFIAMTNAAGPAGLVRVLSHPANPKYAATQSAYLSWAAAVEAFRGAYKDGMVIRVVWGGVAQAKLTIAEDRSANNWKYGGAADFTYASEEATVSIGATYDASGASDKSKVTVECETDDDATCVQNYVDAWTLALNGKALDEVTKTIPFDIPVGPSPTQPAQPPAFESPTPDPTTEAALRISKRRVWKGRQKLHPSIASRLPTPN
jgi:hypothetical protein